MTPPTSRGDEVVSIDTHLEKISHHAKNPLTMLQTAWFGTSVNVSHKWDTNIQWLNMSARK